MVIVRLTESDIKTLCREVLISAGFGNEHIRSISQNLIKCQYHDCHSHGLYRLKMCVETIAAGVLDGHAVPMVCDSDPTIVRVDANRGMSLLAIERGMPSLLQKVSENGLAVLIVNNCFHFSALWPDVEQLSERGFVGLSMVPSHAWVAPAGGRRGTLGTNPIAFSWPRRGKNPFTFDFATSEFARGEIELYHRASKSLPDGVAVDSAGNTTNVPEEALRGAMLPFGGHKGSALSIMIELMAGPLIGDFTSLKSMAFARGTQGAPYHGQIILAMNPERLGSFRSSEDNDRLAEQLFLDIINQGARLPSQRRFEARDRNKKRGYVEVPQALYAELQTLR